MASANFRNFVRNIAIARHNFSSDTLKVLLVSSVPSEANLDSWVARSDVTNEITGTGYTAGGIAQAYTLAALDTTNNKQSITFTNITNGWTSSTFSAVGAIVYKNSGTSTTDYLIDFVDFGGTVTCTAGNFSITYSTSLDINA
ncbi:MAG: hypothetical protein KGL39_36635 [Patescibacteria group bacterium]|nr:hypothetical protein [Patescibacteria group bacterium]